jgi:hypothetical protein
MMHTMSYRQLNYVYGFLKDYVASDHKNNFENKLKSYVEEFLQQLDATGYIDTALTQNGKDRRLSLFNDDSVAEYFGDVYAVEYSCSFVTFAHLNRHRTLKYYIHTPKNSDMRFYVPEIIIDDPKLRDKWISDLESLQNNYPQAMMLDVVEMGNLDDFILKAIERKCSCVQLETTRVVNSVLQRYHNALEFMGHRKVNELGRMLNGAKCTFPNYHCPNPCGFGDAIKETRKI